MHYNFIDVKGHQKVLKTCSSLYLCYLIKCVTDTYLPHYSLVKSCHFLKAHQLATLVPLPGGPSISSP